MLVSLTVGKVDAGVTVLLTQDKRLIEFPSILLPQSISSGSIVDITVARNLSSERAADVGFRGLQDRIYKCFGTEEPETPVIRCLNATQTSVVLEWDPVRLATADLISLALYRNGQKAGNIPRPLMMHTTKISGLAIDTEYTFHLVLRTSAGTYSSEKVVVKTHKLTDLSGITITTGILPAATRERLASAVERIGAKMVEPVRMDTTHFVTTEGRGIGWEKAVESNIPVVRPEWIESCEKRGIILGVTKFYLDAMRPVAVEETSASAPNAPNARPQTQKDLPTPPPAQNNVEGSTHGQDGLDAKKVHVESDDSSQDDSDGERSGPKVLRQDTEQKSKAEARDTQKVALRPGSRPTTSGTASKASSEDSGHGWEKDRKPEVSPDGSSFQEVAL